jgi:hypothetical protein
MNAKDPSVSPDLTRAIADFAFGSQTFTHGSRPLAWLSPDEMDIDLADEKQRRFGDYELLERIGQGGMGVVYRARQHGLERDVAVKLLAAGPWASDEFVARFRREARNAARMQHPNIVEIYEFGHRDGLNFFSMRLVEGPSLAQRLAANGPMPERDAAKCARLLAEAMDYAHRLDVLHLDLKPANVLISHSGEPLIADFGLARRVDAGIGGGNEEISGTPSYMAPEQALQQSHPLTASTDIYGLGAILYEMLTGRPPFRGADAQSTLEAVLHESPPNPRSLRPGLSRDLEAICLRCLEKQPNERFATARELADDLQRFVDGHAVTARPLNSLQRLARWMRREPRLASAVGAALLALAIGGAATALSWREAKQAKAGAEELSLATILPSAQGSSIPRLATLIRERLSDDAREARARELAASADPHDWMTAGLIGRTLLPPLEGELGDAQLRRAAKALPSDRLVLLAAIHSCTTGWVPIVGDAEPGACPVPDAAQRLAKLEPQNLFAWMVLIDPPWNGQEDSYRLMWQYDHDPAARARLRRLLANAAKATTWDSGIDALIAAKSRALGVDYFPMRRPNLTITTYLETRPELEGKYGLWLNWNYAWSPAWFPSAALSKMCNPKLSTLDDATRSDCLQVFRTLADSRASAGWRYMGLAGIARIQKDAASASRRTELWRQAQWIREQDVWARERLPLSRAKEYMQDMAQYGAWEADLRQADHVGVSRMPPASWEARVAIPEARD